MLRVLLVEDSREDALILLDALRTGGYEPVSRRVETADALREALNQESWDLLIVDSMLPRFSGLAALQAVREMGMDLPTIMISGQAGEEYAVEAMRAGAGDYILKGNFSRLVPAIERELREAEVRRERKQAEEALRESEERFRTLANALPQLAWIARPDAYIYWYNQRWYEYTGTTPEQMEGWGWQRVHDPDVLPKVLEQWQASIATGQPFDMVFPLRGADGHFRQFLTRVVPLKDAEGHVLQWFGTNTDITERKQSEEALREKEERLRVALEAADLGTWDLDLTTDVATRSFRHDQIWGFTEPQQEWGLDIAMRHVVPEDRPLIEQAYARAMETGVLYHENRVIWPDGSIHWIAATGRLQRDATGRPIRMVGVVADITERKRADEERERLLAEIQRRLTEVDTIFNGIVDR